MVRARVRVRVGDRVRIRVEVDVLLDRERVGGRVGAVAEDGAKVRVEERLGGKGRP